MDEAAHEVEVQIRHDDGLHMRPAMQFVDTASRFKSDIQVSNKDITVDGKSIMHMTMLAATFGTRLKITAKGADAEEAIDALKKFFETLEHDDHKGSLSGGETNG